MEGAKLEVSALVTFEGNIETGEVEITNLEILGEGDTIDFGTVEPDWGDEDDRVDNDNPVDSHGAQQKPEAAGDATDEWWERSERGSVGGNVDRGRANRTDLNGPKTTSCKTRCKPSAKTGPRRRKKAGAPGKIRTRGPQIRSFWLAW